MIRWVTFYVLAFALIAGGCSASKDGSSDSALDEEGDSLTYDTRRNPDAAEAPYDSMKPKVSADSLAVIEFENDFHDFGNIKDGAVVKHVYKFKNTGKSKLIVTQVIADCGCTTPFWSKEPLEPGKSGEITVQFDSKGKTGRVNKTITVEANTEEPRHYIRFRAEVTP